MMRTQVYGEYFKPTGKLASSSLVERKVDDVQNLTNLKLFKVKQNSFSRFRHDLAVLLRHLSLVVSLLK